MDRTDIEEKLATCELFAGLEQEDIARLTALCEVRDLEAGEHLFRQGDSGQHLYVIVSGHILLERSMDLGGRFGTVAIGLLGSGRALGCWSALLDDTHNLLSSAICQKPTRVLVIKGADLRRMMVTNREMGFKLLEKVCFLLRERIQSAYGAMEKL